MEWATTTRDDQDGRKQDVFSPAAVMFGNHMCNHIDLVGSLQGQVQGR
jgi:hypothetical protein